jgi:hypothetical protein
MVSKSSDHEPFRAGSGNRTIMLIGSCWIRAFLIVVFDLPIFKIINLWVKAEDVSVLQRRATAETT